MYIGSENQVKKFASFNSVMNALGLIIPYFTLSDIYNDDRIDIYGSTFTASCMAIDLTFL